MTRDPVVEMPEGESERASRRAGILLVLVGVVLMALAATDTAAAAKSAPETVSPDEIHLKSSGWEITPQIRF